MTLKSEHITEMALVRTIRPWEHASTAEHKDELEAIGTSLQLGLSDEVGTLYVPVTRDENIGRVAYYLAQSLNKNGLHTITPDSSKAQEFGDLILSTRTDASAARHAIPEMVELANSLAQLHLSRKVGAGALIVVTSEPFILGALRHQEEAHAIPPHARTFRVESGEVVPVDLTVFEQS